jgi:hypothetical protein
MKIKAIYSFVLKCKICGREVSVGDTQEFKEKGTKDNLIAYYSPEVNEEGKLIIMGISQGTGDTFECFPCHVLKWANQSQPNEEGE